MTYRDPTELVNYHYWARDRALAAVERLTPDQFAQDLGNSLGSIKDTLTHLCGRLDLVLTLAGRVPQSHAVEQRVLRPGLAPCRMEQTRTRGAFGTRRVRARWGTGRCCLSRDRRNRGPHCLRAHAATRRQPRVVSSRTDHDDAATARRPGAGEHGFDHTASRPGANGRDARLAQTISGSVFPRASSCHTGWSRPARRIGRCVQRSSTARWS